MFNFFKKQTHASSVNQVMTSWISTLIEDVLKDYSDRYIYFVVASLQEAKQYRKFMAYRGLVGEVLLNSRVVSGWSSNHPNAMLICTSLIFHHPLYLQISTRLRHPKARHFVWTERYI